MTLVAVIAAALVIAAIIIAVVLIIKHNKAKDVASRSKAFENPMYDDTAQTFSADYDQSISDSYLEPETGTSGYMDVPAAGPASGYMDVAPDGDEDSDGDI